MENRHIYYRDAESAEGKTKGKRKNISACVLRMLRIRERKRATEIFTTEEQTPCYTESV